MVKPNDLIRWGKLLRWGLRVSGDGRTYFKDGLPDLEPGEHVTIKTDRLSDWEKPYSLTVVEVGTFTVELKGPKGGRIDILLSAHGPWGFLMRGAANLGTITNITQEDK